MNPSYDVVICGAGIVGIATAHALALSHGVRQLLLIDERPPLTLTSDKSTEAYRNWWPGPDDAMVRFMNRSIDLLESWADASDNRFLLNRRGYLYTTTDSTKADQFASDAERASMQGAGPVRVYRSADDAKAYAPSAHRGFHGAPSGADLFLGRDAIAAHFGFLSRDIVAVLHARRCGWLSGQQLGMYLLGEAKAAGVVVLQGRVSGVSQSSGRIEGVEVTASDGTMQRIHTRVFVNAAGPYARAVSNLLGVDLPLFSELHLKVAFEDTRAAVDRNTGLVILDDAQTLPWPDDVRDELAADEATRWMTEALPAGIHLRPDGYDTSQTVLMLWDYHSAHRYDAPEFPLPDDPYYAELAMRGLVRLVPAMAQYLDALPHSYIDGGYYTKTVENRPLIGPLPIEGAYVNAGHSGFGLMAAPAAAELLAAQIAGTAVPDYAASFALTRYGNPAYQRLLADWGSTGQL